MKTLNVNLNRKVDNSYKIDIGTDIVQKLLDEYSDAYFMADANVYSLYRHLFDGRKVFVFESGEKNKTLDSVSAVLSFLNENGCRRDGTLVVIGGGICGDTGGFAASCYMRGIKFVQVPTTLLSMVDSSVGGKTGVNFAGSKNNVGAFYQPDKVIIDTAFLKTLPKLEYYNGIAEVIKYGAIFDEALFETLKTDAEKMLRQQSGFLEDIVYKCCAIKAQVVERDERESGERKLLNFGHTFGHAIEADSGYAVGHGFAVATGMYLETDYARREDIAEESALERIGEILRLYGFDTAYAIADEEKFFRALSSDKKADRTGLTLALTPKIGSGKIISGVSENSVRNYFCG